MIYRDYTIAIKASLAWGISKMIRLLIVDDHLAVRQGLRMRLGAEPDLEVVGEAADGEVALSSAQALCPDVVLMDVEMPHMDGIAATGTMRKLCPSAAVIVLSMYDDARTRAQAHNAGAVAFVAKSLPTDILLTTIRQVAP